MAKAVFIHQWVGLLITLIALAGLASTVWSLVQNVYLYECPEPPPGIPEKEIVPVRCPSLMERVGWQMPGLFIGCAVLLFGLWTYRRGREGIPLVSVK